MRYAVRDVGLMTSQHVVERSFILHRAPPNSRLKHRVQMIRAPALPSRGDRFCPPAISPACAELAREPSRRHPAHPMPERHRKVTTDKTFADLGVPPALISVLAARGITQPFPIQVQTLPDTLAGRDVLGRGKTGSGKTLAFSIPLVSRLSAGKRRPSRPSGLVLAPTRELATQIAAALEPLAAAYNLRVTTIFGGVPQTGRWPPSNPASTSWWPARVGSRT